MNEPFDDLMDYLISLFIQIKHDITGLDDWTLIHLVNFFANVLFNGQVPPISAEDIFDPSPNSLHEFHTKSLLHSRLIMGRGRRFARTEKGRLGLVPAIDSKGREEGKRGTAIVVLHGCTVSILLERVDGKDEEEEGGEWRVIGGCYIEGIMFGESVDWEPEDARGFTLV